MGKSWSDDDKKNNAYSMFMTLIKCSLTSFDHDPSIE